MDVDLGTIDSIVWCINISEISAYRLKKLALIDIRYATKNAGC